MRPALAALALALAAAAPAEAAETVGRATLSAGPVIAGDGVAWAEHARSRALRLVTARPGARPVVRRRWRAPDDRRSLRGVMDLAVDGGRAAAVLNTCTRYPRRGLADWFPCAERAHTGPLERLAGPLPDRARRHCAERRNNAKAVAAGGGWTATVLSRFCGSNSYASAAAAKRDVIVARKGRRTRTIPVRIAHEPRIAGDRLAWLDGAGGAVLYDLRRGERVRAVSKRAGWIMALDVQADGTLALVRSRGVEHACVTLLGAAEQELECGNLEGAVAVHGGRALIASSDGVRLAAPGAAALVLDHLGPRAVRVGELDLGPRLATWAVQARRFPAGPDGMPRGPEDVGKPRIVVHRLG